MDGISYSEDRRAYQREWMRRYRAQRPGYRKIEVERSRKWQKANPVWNSWLNTKRSARQRGYEWGLEREAFDALVLADCYYCGAAPSPVNGVDRIDNSQGYIAGNVTTACQHCNYAKRQMNRQDFINWVRRVAAHNQEK